MSSFIFVIVCGTFWAEASSVQGFSRLFILCIVVGDPVIKRGEGEGRGGGPINRFNSSTFPTDFQRHMSWSFCVQWVQLRSEMIVRFADIGGIDDRHC